MPQTVHFGFWVGKSLGGRVAMAAGVGSQLKKTTAVIQARDDAGSDQVAVMSW